MAEEAQRLGKYHILEELGAGGFATVYLARDTALDREVALKILHPQLLADRTFVQRFRSEARTVANLNHPHITTIYDIGELDDRLFIAMELVRGPSLAEIVAERGRIEWEEMLAILEPICAALDYAHERGVVHRDLKPGNILLSDERTPMLTDFGFARMIGESSVSLSISGGIVGTPGYIAPEVWDLNAAEAPADIYALGCVVYEMLTGQALFAGDTPMQALRAHDRGPQFPSTWPDDVPAGIEAVLRRALARDPEERYGSAGEFYEGLRRLPGDEPTPVLVTAAGGELPRPWLWAGGAVVALVLVVGTALAIGRGSPPSVPATMTAANGVSGEVVVGQTVTTTATATSTQTATPAPSATSTPTQPATATMTATPAPSSTPTATATARPATVTPSPVVVPPTQTPIPTPTQVVPTTSTDQVAFSSDRDGNPEIYLIATDGTGVTRLTNHPAHDNFPSWSPDGTQLAFLSARDEGGIYVMNADGTNVRHLTSGGGGPPAWSPDGTRIAFTSDNEIHTINVDGSEKTQVTSNGGNNSCPSWSPDGSRIAYYQWRSQSDHSIRVINVDGTDDREISSEGACPVWSPDSTQLAFNFSPEPAEGSEIYLMNADGSNKRRLTHSPGLDYGPTWSPDGTWLAFYSLRDGNHEIYAMKRDGSELTRITNSPSGDSRPAWRP